MTRKNKNREEHVNHERWLITYADLITLLLIFFIIMYSMSKVDINKYAELAKTLQFQFKKSDSMLPSGSGAIGGADIGKGTTGDQKGKNEKIEQTAKEKEAQEKELQALNKIIQQYVDENKLQNHVLVSDTQKGIAITLNDLFLFDLGKADLKPPAYPILDKLASLFTTLSTKVSIEGHTDNLPLATGSVFKNNWRLSFERSLSVLSYFTTNSKLPDSMFQSMGYADTKPVVPNDSNENRQKNRRVEIIVLRNNYTANGEQLAR